MISKKTKIVATMGPSTNNREVLKKMIQEGMNVCRINFSHGKHQDYKALVEMLRSLDDELNVHTAILADLQGPKLRIGDVENGSFSVKKGDEILIGIEDVLGNKDRLSITHLDFPTDVEEGEVILIDDGKLQLEILKTDKDKWVTAKFLNDGVVSSKKGVNLPDTKVSIPSLTEKDLKDLQFALDMDFDWIGLSFVRDPEDVIQLKNIITAKNKHARVVAKIEKPEAIKHIKEIIRYSDAIMIARGDLGVEIPMQDVPLVQKRIIRLCKKMAKPTIVATQMMESMIESPTPTRAEVNDVANAVLDNTDAVMLSAETSVGKYPVETIHAMTQIIKRIEQYKQEKIQPKKNVNYQNERFITDSICFSSAELSNKVGAKAIVIMTHSGYSAYRISSMRPNANIFAFTSNKKLLTQLSLVWGVDCKYYDKTVGTDETISDIIERLTEDKDVKKGDLIVNIASMPVKETGMSNMMKLSRV
jgi:pyruvate kinase